jgi:hypothetical protein
LHPIYRNALAPGVSHKIFPAVTTLCLFVGATAAAATHTIRDQVVDCLLHMQHITNLI